MGFAVRTRLSANPAAGVRASTGATYPGVLPPAILPQGVMLLESVPQSPLVRHPLTQTFDFALTHGPRPAGFHLVVALLKLSVRPSTAWSPSLLYTLPEACAQAAGTQVSLACEPAVMYFRRRDLITSPATTVLVDRDRYRRPMMRTRKVRRTRGLSLNLNGH